MYALVLTCPEDNEVHAAVSRVGVEELDEALVIGTHALMLP